MPPTMPSPASRCGPAGSTGRAGHPLRLTGNGSPPPVFNFDEDHRYFAADLPFHPDARAGASDLHGDLHVPGTGQVTERAAKLVDHIEGEMTRQDLQGTLALGNRDHFRKAYLLPALEAGLVEMTQPDKPNSRTQRYRLTSAGNELRRPRGGKS